MMQQFVLSFGRDILACLRVGDPKYVTDMVGP